MNPEDCFTPLKEKAVEVPDYIEWLINEDPEWQEHFSFDAFPIPLEFIDIEPALKKLDQIWPINRLGLLRISSMTVYDWHVDQHPKPVRGNVRKISMTLFLNDDYEGGEFDLEIYRPDADPRYKTFKLKPGSAIFFQGDQWHRVRPVTSGIRKSLVAWFYGPPYV